MTGLTFEASTHTYTLDGVVTPSVTGVLKPLIDFSGIPDYTLEAARARGTIVHEAIAYHNEGTLNHMAFLADFPEYAGYLDGWLAFTAQRRFVPRVCECRVASRRLHVAGTLDVLGELDGEAVLLDYATGDPRSVSKDYQTAAYLGLALEWAQEPDGDPRLRAFFAMHALVRRYAVALRKDGTFQLHPYTDPSDFRKFLALVEAYRIVTARRAELSRVEVSL